eukprot:COSAG06_NODE_150_length_22019_cov_17.221031_6_plen_99_part_00
MLLVVLCIAPHSGSVPYSALRACMDPFNFPAIGDSRAVGLEAPVSYVILWLRLNAPFCAALIALGPVAVFQCRTTVAYWRLPAMVMTCSSLISVILNF